MGLPAVVLFLVLNVEPELVTNLVNSSLKLRAANLEDFRQRNPAAASFDQERKDAAALRDAGVCGRRHDAKAKTEKTGQKDIKTSGLEQIKNPV
jgi:hypothetical protein